MQYLYGGATPAPFAHDSPPGAIASGVQPRELGTTGARCRLRRLASVAREYQGRRGGYILDAVTAGRSREFFDIGVAALEASLVESRLFRAESESRIARLKLAEEYRRAGREDEAQALFAEVKAEQDAHDALRVTARDA